MRRSLLLARVPFRGREGSFAASPFPMVRDEHAGPSTVPAAPSTRHDRKGRTQTNTCTRRQLMTHCGRLDYMMLLHQKGALCLRVTTLRFGTHSGFVNYRVPSVHANGSSHSAPLR